jgi:hypothetical protein
MLSCNMESRYMKNSHVLACGQHRESEGQVMMSWGYLLLVGEGAPGMHSAVTEMRANRPRNGE